VIRLGQSVSLAEATPAAGIHSSRRRALLALLPTDEQILSLLAAEPPTQVGRDNYTAAVDPNIKE
jgi:hypothetical protein